jgi:hypothetical protein
VPHGRFWVKRLDEIPLVPTDDPDDLTGTRFSITSGSALSA